MGLLIPMGRAASAIWQGTVACLKVSCACLHLAGSRLGRLCKDAAGWTYARVLMPVGDCTQTIYLCTVVPTCRGIATFFNGCIHYAKVLRVAIQHYICIPSGNCLCACF